MTNLNMIYNVLMNPTCQHTKKSKLATFEITVKSVSVDLQGKGAERVKMFSPRDILVVMVKARGNEIN